MTMAPSRSTSTSLPARCQRAIGTRSSTAMAMVPGSRRSTWASLTQESFFSLWRTASGSTASIGVPRWTSIAAIMSAAPVSLRPVTSTSWTERPASAVRNRRPMPSPTVPARQTW
jgi:hypothetical protein